MDYIVDFLSKLDWIEVTATSSSSFLLVFAAEIGDKSQLVCMALAARYKALPVMMGALLAFVLLNTLAVVFGATIANLLPAIVISAVVALLFAVFGILALRIEEEEEEDEQVAVRTSGSIFIGTFLLITVAEFGDKTQLAVVGLGSTSLPIAVWLGATLALTVTSGLGVWAGRTIFQKLPITLLHKISGVIFIFLAIFAGYKTYLSFIGL